MKTFFVCAFTLAGTYSIGCALLCAYIYRLDCKSKNQDGAMLCATLIILNIILAAANFGALMNMK